MMGYGLEGREQYNFSPLYSVQAGSGDLPSLLSVFFSFVKRLECESDHTPQSNAEVRM
jgi:hypothetical protein